MATLPAIREKPLTCADHKHTVLVLPTSKKRPTSGSKSLFPITRKFSYEGQERQKELERGFILDGVVLSRLTNEETGRTHPSINIGIPQYKAQQDRHCNTYFQTEAIPKKIPEGPMIGKVEEKFFKSTEAIYYLKDRLEKGTSYTRCLYGGHMTVPTDPSKDGYNGSEGYRRNTFDLRKQRSVFDYEDPFENPKPINRHLRTQSAPATMKLMRQRSACAYMSHPGGSEGSSSLGIGNGRRKVQSAFPTPVRVLATGPL